MPTKPILEDFINARISYLLRRHSRRRARSGWLYTRSFLFVARYCLYSEGMVIDHVPSIVRCLKRTITGRAGDLSCHNGQKTAKPCKRIKGECNHRTDCRNYCRHAHPLAHSARTRISRFASGIRLTTSSAWSPSVLTASCAAPAARISTPGLALVPISCHTSVTVAVSFLIRSLTQIHRSVAADLLDDGISSARRGGHTAIEQSSIDILRRVVHPMLSPDRKRMTP